ncbi:MAG: hypothetical protein ACREM2_01575 [Vulcanimicrobiaceae bacterium]
MKLAAPRVEALFARGDATPFRPFGKTMREWVALHQSGDDLDALAALFDEAVAYAKSRSA